MFWGFLFLGFGMDTTQVGPKEHRPVVRLLRQSYLLMVFSLALGILIWHFVARYSGLPSFMIPTPTAVYERFILALQDGTLLSNTLATLEEVLAGLAAGVSTAAVLGYLLAKSKSLEKILAPFIVASQSIPVVAIAPLLVIWFGPGLISKVLICTLIVFFPVLINTVVGLRSVPDDLRDLMRSLQATRWQTFTLLEVPASLPVLLGGVRIGATLSVIGAVVGEFVGADEGLGFLINQARGIYDTALVFVCVFTLIVMAMVLYGLVALLEGHLLSWQKKPDRTTLPQG
jgi:NitT/TauT family transport system permease protein